MLMSETWLDCNFDSTVINRPGYTLFRKDPIGRGGGVGAYVKADLLCAVTDVGYSPYSSRGWAAVR
ncbi:unnamed protein product [Acanthoscelides obtectus]|uniref:Uncharacterized protein n=1 Tax=Acanthoscelides obtectus TaxID=200917 RepID=A0A9P0KY61_ACAOB|nr:unnamed protein product [Acanthoscelides obtectus]CAK1650878.1 hypothetical protein AOBTE_LOCUS16942 [Acanthoscelides obtectus]